jgi:hypothetical protein
MMHEIDVQPLAQARRNQGLEAVMVGLFTAPLHKAKSGEDPGHMSIHGELVAVEGV